jgi:hypothetical protein
LNNIRKILSEKDCSDVDEQNYRVENWINIT